MPVLPGGFTARVGEAQSQTYVGGRRAQAEDFGAGIGAALTQGGQLTQEIVQREMQVAARITEENDVRRTLVDNQKLRAKYADALREAETTGQPLDKLRERFQSELDSIRNGAGTPKGLAMAEQHGAVTLEMFNTAARGIESTRAGSALVRDVRASDAASAALFQINPTLLDQALKERDALLDTFRGRVAPELIERARIEGREALTAASVNAAIEKDPRTALSLLQNPEHAPWGALNPAQRAQLINVSQTAIKAAEADERRRKHEAEEERRQTQQKVMDSMLQDFSDGKGGAWTGKKIMGLTGVDFEHKVKMLHTLEYITKPKKQQGDGDSAFVNQVYERMFLPDGHASKITEPEQIDQYLGAGKMNMRQHAALRNVLANLDKPGQREVNDFLRRGTRQLVPSDPLGRMTDPFAAQAAEQWRRDVQERIDELKGEKQDWRKVMDPKSEAYMGGDRLMRYQSAARQRLMQSQLEAVRAAEGAAGGGPNPAVAAPRPASSVPIVRTPAEAAALPKGTSFMTPDGQLRTRQ